MKMYFRTLPIYLFLVTLILPMIAICAQASPPSIGLRVNLPPLQEASSAPTLSPPPSPADIINAINNLRLRHGLNALAVHPVLMQVAANQANALAASGGAVGHQRSCGMTLGQELLMLGFPLWGDLSLDGYRSENQAERRGVKRRDPSRGR